MWLEDLLTNSHIVLPTNFLNNDYLTEKGFESFRPDGEGGKKYYEYFSTDSIATYIDGENGKLFSFDFDANRVLLPEEIYSILKELGIYFQ